MEYRRFGGTELQIPVITCGAMRFQQSWKDDDPVSDESQRNVEECIRHALELGINHIETARGYGTSEYQLGKVLPSLPRDRIYVQTKVGPSKNVAEFAETFERSMSLLHLDYVDLFSFHGVNDDAVLEAAMVCMDTALAWKREGRIRDIGFSTHGGVETVRKAIETGAFEHVNLHWYFIYQDHWENILEARRRDMGVLIISPNDKAGMLYKPSEKLLRLCDPLHPMVFNGLFCLARPEVHTISVGVSRAADFDTHMETVALLPRAREMVAPIERRLHEEMTRTLGEDWVATWDQGLPRWDEAPGEMNIEWILRLRNLVLAFDMIEYAKMRYNLLGNGGHWFPGNKADRVQELDLGACLKRSPHAHRIPDYLMEAHRMLEGEPVKRLQKNEQQ
ncbi:MAG: aldo/keto reductase [Candidatus Hydrogenedentes bacterium]|nr:aldo/keto reductase [Candidatus Hydrogenedentota bacterium]